MSVDKTSFAEAIEMRRSIYTLTDKLPIADSRVTELVNHAMEYVPSSFDSRSTRLVVLLNAEHKKFWDIVLEVLQPHLTDPEKAKRTNGRISGFRDGAGTILFFEDPNPIKQLSEKMPAYADKYPQWAEHTNAMHQYALWVALEAEGCGCNLQHYNPLPDQRAKQEWEINPEWQLKAQLVFGGLAEGWKEKLQPKDLAGRKDGARIVGAQ